MQALLLIYCRLVVFPRPRKATAARAGCAAEVAELHAILFAFRDDEVEQ